MAKHKRGAFAKEFRRVTDIQVDRAMEIEFYDYDTQGGVLELDNRPDDPMARRMLDCLLRVFLPTELRAPLPAPCVRNSVCPSSDSSRTRRCWKNRPAVPLVSAKGRLAR